MEVVARIRKWGNSIGIVIPKETAEEEHLKPNDRVIAEIKKPAQINELFGSLKTKKSAQQLKDEAREGWHD